MAILMIGYDLKSPGQNYSDLTDRLKEFGTRWHHLDSTWLVETDMTPKEMRDELKQYIDANDELLVIEVSGKAAAWAGFSERGANWLLTNLG